MRISTMVRRLLAHWDSADAATKAAGSSWYDVARGECCRIAKAHGVTPRCVAGVVAALSPRLQWTANVRAAEAVVRGDEHIPGVFRASLVKARAIRQGARPLTVLSGPKVRAFYRALCGDEHAAVVDVWVTRAIGWVGDVKAKAYALMAEALRRAAEAVGTTVARLQAVAWVVVRGRA